MWEPEFVKVLLGRRRYQALMGAISNVEGYLDVASTLVKKYEPPAEHSYQIPDVEELEGDVAKAEDALGGLHRTVRKYESELLTKEWSVK